MQMSVQPAAKGLQALAAPPPRYTKVIANHSHRDYAYRNRLQMVTH
jgi:hypothetical protein